ncbi:LCP family protein [Leifsonia aquatica]|uniref:Cell envelope-like function transcriptional attenuator common domain protein n=2 Tax=Leifsonia aquatica TaxID=144185 RepID=U2T443_LEIAQ|nr:LCP family protein [Leifsonia aquatica]ERK72268.1 cell envelope-like function transcriptional attenuator common domain protein [Leifsonia aquatica ATCC 14665]MBB2966294.1 LCP family protein required for cell wall assembly [Leifsonia aquatica]
MTDLPRRHQRARGPLPVRHGQLRRRRAIGTVFGLIAGALAVVLVSIGGVGAYAVWDVARSVKTGVKLVSAPGHTQQAIPDVAAMEGGINVLIAGTDSRSGLGGIYESDDEQDASSGEGNNDVTMLLHIAQDHKSMMVVSFPRDLMIAIPDCPAQNGDGTVDGSDYAQFNTALSRGGLACVVLTVEKMTGLTIPFGAVINFAGVSAMSTAVGGVTVCLASPVEDEYTNPPLDLPAGNSELVGDEALSFLRSRHGVGDGSDLGRISNQQVFLSALARKIVSGGVLSNPVQLYGLAKAAVNSVTPSESLSNPTTLVQIALAVKDTGLENMVFVQYPTVTDPDNVNRVVPQSSAARALNEALVNDVAVKLTGSTGRAAEDPNATATPDPTESDSTAPEAPAAPTTDAAATPAPDPSSTAVELPSSITGQTAAQQTCTKGNN